jgi:hypothetical protein
VDGRAEELEQFAFTFHNEMKEFVAISFKDTDWTVRRKGCDCPFSLPEYASGNTMRSFQLA